MPNRDGTGPQGQGPMTGRGMGARDSAFMKPNRVQGQGMGRGQGMGPGRQGIGSGKCPTDATPRQQAMCRQMQGGKKTATLQVQSKGPKGKVEVERNVPMRKARGMMGK